MSNKDMTSATKQKTHRRNAGRHRPTWEVAYLFPRQGTWTEDDYLELEESYGDNPRLELSGGRLEILPMPKQIHQFIMLYLYRLLTAFAEDQAPGKVLVSGMKVKLETGKVRQPDVLYMKAENSRRRRENFSEGADLVMEIVSGDSKNRKRDLVTKPREYAAAGIPEYWIIDPKKRYIRVLTVEGHTYKLHGEFGLGTQATSVLLPGFVVPVDEALAPPESR
jgi:Uma2 family endonuclease